MKYVKIITDEPRMLRMLSLELADYGFEVVKEFDSSFFQSNNEFYIVADTDRTDIAGIDSSNAVLIGYSRTNSDVSDKYHHTILHRPFKTSELVSHLGGSIPVRTPAAPNKQAEKAPVSNSLLIDTVTRSAEYGDTKMSFSDNEFRVLYELYRNKGEVVSRESIDALLGVTEGNMSDVYVCHLRRKIDNKLGLKLIYTIRGKGYMLKI